MQIVIQFGISRLSSALWIDSWNTLYPGVVTSPNYPLHYPNNIEKLMKIQVESGKILRLEFTFFEVVGELQSKCQNFDFVKIIDGDGTTLMDKSCGSSSDPTSSTDYFLPPILTTKSNKVEIFFHTNGGGAWGGWSLSWSAVSKKWKYWRKKWK